MHPCGKENVRDVACVRKRALSHETVQYTKYWTTIHIMLSCHILIWKTITRERVKMLRTPNQTITLEIKTSTIMFQLTNRNDHFPHTLEVNQLIAWAGDCSIAIVWITRMKVTNRTIKIWTYIIQWIKDTRH